MEAEAEGVTEEGGSMDGNENDEDVQEGIPVRGNSIGDVNPKLPSPSGTLGNLRAPTSSNQQGEPSGGLR